jgi:protoporphyrinogen oxidase
MTPVRTSDVAILGAGPSGLAAAYCLARSGMDVAVVERGSQVGGLMRGVRRGDFCFDLGRKELHSRFPEVHQLWHKLLGDDYRVYPHHSGLLYNGRILEKTSAQRGRLRGMSPAQAARLAASYFLSQVRPGERVATNLEDFYLLRYGRAYYEYFIYGYGLKFAGPPRDSAAPYGEQAIARFALIRPLGNGGTGRSRSVPAQEVWRHPARGTSQIADALETEARAAGATFLLNAEVLALDVSSGPSVKIRCNGSETELSARYVISSIPLPLLLRLLRPAPPPDVRLIPNELRCFRKSTVLIYIMADEPPRFPHNWLEVTDLSARVGRIVNYATWNGEMVPPGKTGLCMEYFCLAGDGLMDLSDGKLRKLAVDEAVGAGLVDRQRIMDTLVVKLPQANAAAASSEWKQPWMARATDYIRGIPDLYETNRPGIDRAALAGIDAATACLTGTPMSDRSLEHMP